MATDVRFDSGSQHEVGSATGSFGPQVGMPLDSGTQSTGFQTNELEVPSYDYFGSLSEQVPNDYVPREAYEPSTPSMSVQSLSADQVTSQPRQQAAAQPSPVMQESSRQQPSQASYAQAQVTAMPRLQFQNASAQPMPMRPTEQQEQPQQAAVTTGDASDFFEMLDTASKRSRTTSANEILERGQSDEEFREDPSYQMVSQGYADAQRREYGWAGVEEGEEKLKAMRAAEQQDSRQIGDAATRAERKLQKSAIASETQQEERPFWLNPIDRFVRFGRNMIRRNPDAIDKAKSIASRAFKREGVGNRIWGKIIGDSSLAFREVGVGVQEILAVQAQNPAMLEQLLEPVLGVNGVPENVGLMSQSQLIDAINNNEIYVGTFKPPNNQGPDIQRRRLKVLERHQRGIFLHNIMAAMYTADYDGDDMEISLDPTVADKAKDPMDHIFDIFGKTTLNMDFIKVVNIEDVTDDDGKVIQDRWHYVRDTILADFMLDEYGNQIDRRIISPLVESILKLSDSAFEDDDARAKAFGDMLREARKFADRMARASFVPRARKGVSDDEMSSIVKAVFDNMQEIAYQNALTTIGADVLTLETEEVPEPITYDDRVLYSIIDGMVTGSVPNNFQDVKLLLTGFTGNVAKKNAPFRFTADVGKMAKMDSRLMVGNEYVVDVNNEKHMKMFFRSAAKYAASLRMMRDIKKDGRKDYYMQLLRQKVIEEVGFPNDDRYLDPETGEHDFTRFLMDFSMSYNRHSMTINEANKVFLTNMRVSETESHGLVSPINATGKGKNGRTYTTYSDLAEPMLTVYGKYSVGRMFSDLITTKHMVRGNVDMRWAGRSDKNNTHFLEREYDQIGNPYSFWVTGKYIDYSLRKFRNENRLVGIAGDLKKAINRRVSDRTEPNNRRMFEMMLAIADKRTGVASRFNTDTYGNDKYGHGWNERSTTRMLSQMLTSVAADLRQGGSVIAPGYYAGIGSRDIPDDKSKAMTDLAKILRERYGFVLRSGDAKGSDQAFARGAGNMAVSFVSGKKHRLSDAAAESTMVIFDNMDEAMQAPALDAIQRLHPNPDSFVGKDSEYVRNLMARNFYQVVGYNGFADSAFVACYATDDDNGTWHAIRVAHERGIPVFNLAEYSDPQDWINDVCDAAERSWQGKLFTEPVGNDQPLRVENALRAVISANRDMFMHYNMDSPATFLDSPYGHKLLQYAGNQEMIGSIYMSMVFDWRMDRVTSLTEQLYGQQTVDRFKKVWDDLNLAKDELSSASETWHAIIREFEMESTKGEKSFFQQMREHGFGNWDIDGRQLKWSTANVEFAAPEFWNKGGLDKYRNLRQVIDDLDLDLTTKRNVIADVVRYWEKDAWFKSYEVGYQLEIGNDSTYTLGSSPSKKAMQAHIDFEQAFNKWGRSGSTALREDVERARATFGGKPGMLMNALRNLDKNQWELVSINDGMYADSVLSVYDKTYAQTEKANQNPWTNAIYAAVSYQTNGGYMNDVTRTNDRMLGITAAESVTIQDIIHLFANPSETMTISLNGDLGLISRDILIENELSPEERTGDIEQDMWEFFNRNPRIASAIRLHSACVNESSDGGGYIGASASITETVRSMSYVAPDPIGHAKYLMRDHPAYAAIIALALPGFGIETRNARNRVTQIENYFITKMCQAANDPDYGNMSMASGVLEDMGITEESLRSALKSDYESYLEELGIDTRQHLVQNENKEWVTESEREADDIYSYALERVSAYISEIREAGIGTVEDVDQPEFMLPTTSSRDEDDRLKTKPDSTSVAAFWDVIQELSGAKTSVSTGVEGGETYRHAEWISHMRPKDRFVDIMSIDDVSNFDETWDGLWTSLKNLDGSPVLLESSTDPTVGLALTMTTRDSENNPQTKTYIMSDGDFSDALRDYNESVGPDEKMDEVSVLVPDGYQVKDRSTDTHGLQVPSLFACMVSKRTNGAEAFNLKAKKAGIDNKDSITKKMPGGRHKLDEETGGYVSFGRILGQLRETYARQGKVGAQLELAKMMLKENRELGYEDLTLSNYLSIADVMLIECDDGNLYLRSIEMLSAAIKNRIGWRGDDMTDEEMFERVSEIVNDTSENAVGRRLMTSLEALDSFSPKSKSFQHSAVRQQSSVFERTYPLMQKIQEDARKLGIEPLGYSRASSMNDDNIRQLFMDDKGKWVKGSSEIRGFLSGYNVTTIAVMGESDATLDNKRVWSIGPTSVVFMVGSTSEGVTYEAMERDAKRIYERASDLGMTVAIHTAYLGFLPEIAQKDAVPAGDGYAIIPCFDSRLNGSEATPSRGQWEISQTPFSRYVISVEDSVNEFGLGDAEAQAFKALTDRMSMRDGSSLQQSARDMFPNIYGNEEYAKCSKIVRLASAETVLSHIAEEVRCTIDYGVPAGTRDFDRRVKDIARAVERYQNRWSETNSKALLMGVELEPGDIFGWYECEIRHPNGRVEYALAPIIPFELHGVKRQPSKFTVENFGPVNNDETLFNIDWENRTSLTDGYVKYFDSSGGANKGMISLSATNEEQRTLLDGTPIDIYIAKQSTDSRKVGTDRRIKTMISMMTLARMHGYNFARNSDGSLNMAAFPDNPTIEVNGEKIGVREALYRDRISRDQWKSLLAKGIRFTSDKTLDAFIRFECNKIMSNGGNPSDYLANLYTDEEGNESNTHVMWEFEAMFEQGMMYEDGLLKFMRFINPISETSGSSGIKYFCPDGIDDSSTDGVLFRLYQTDGEIAKDYDRGILQMRVPHKLSSGQIAYAWDNVSIGMSFFGEEYSGFSRPNIDGASNFLDGMNTMSMYGKRLRGDEAKHRFEWASSDFARPRSNGSLEAIF